MSPTERRTNRNPTSAPEEMSHDRPLLKAIGSLWARLPSRRRGQFYLLFGLTIVASAAEVFSLALVFPLLALLSAPDTVFDHPAIKGLAWLIATSDRSTITLAITIGFCAASLFAGTIRLAVLYANTRYSFGIGAELSAEAYRRTLYQPYRTHLMQNSSTLISGITNKTMAVASNIIAQLLTLLTSFLVGLSVVVVLLWTAPVIAIATGVTFAGTYLVILAAVRGRLKRNSDIIVGEYARALQALQEGLGGIRDVLIDGTQETFTRIYRSADRPYKLAMGNNVVIAGSPRFVVETVGMVLIAAIAFVITRGGAVSSAIPILGVLAVGAQRLLPLLQQIYSAVATIRGSEASLHDVSELLDQRMPSAAAEGARPVQFNRFIELKDVGFAYSPTGPVVLRDVSLRIPKGARVGVFGTTGGGKSTMLDVIMGLLSPSSGSLLVDGMTVDEALQSSWRRHIAHVPQSIFLSDGTVAENIALGVPSEERDIDRMRAAAAAAQIDKTILSWPQGYQTTVGERGVRLSAGQRQRIGVARALYKEADVIILDEATSALDNTTEEALISAIESLGPELTIVMVAHRLTTLRSCDLLFEVADCRVRRVEGYSALAGGAANHDREPP